MFQLGLSDHSVELLITAVSKFIACLGIFATHANTLEIFVFSVCSDKVESGHIALNTAS